MNSDYMPNRDGTGPDGKGKKTGRGLGICDSDNNETVLPPRPRRGRRRP